jgi:hypothetical protein
MAVVSDDDDVANPTFCLTTTDDCADTDEEDEESSASGGRLTPADMAVSPGDGEAERDGEAGTEPNTNPISSLEGCRPLAAPPTWPPNPERTCECDAK